MLDKKVVLITGAAGKIGAALTNSILKAGAKAILIDNNKERLNEFESKLSKKDIVTIIANTSSPVEVDKCISIALDRFGKIDAVIHTAYPRSAGWGARFEEIKKEHLDEDLSQHLGGAILLSQRILEFFKKQGYGNLVHVASIMGVVTPKFENYSGTKMNSPIEYTAIKAALIATTKYLAKYYKGNHIRVNCISPGGILDQQPESFLNKYRACCNEKGMLNADDLVGVVLFLLSEHSRFITGQNIIIDDGWSL